MVRLIVPIILLGGVALVIWLFVAIVTWCTDALDAYRKHAAAISAKRKVERQRRLELIAESERQQRLVDEENKRRKEEEETTQYRQQHPAKIIGVPDKSVLMQVVTTLRDYVDNANAYRPKFDP